MAKVVSAEDANRVGQLGASCQAKIDPIELEISGAVRGIGVFETVVVLAMLILDLCADQNPASVILAPRPAPM